jgi:hypothetical protein
MKSRRRWRRPLHHPRGLAVIFGLALASAWACLLLTAAPAECEGLLAAESLRIRHTFDDNVAYQGKADMVTQIQPSLSLSRDEGGNRWMLQGKADYRTYKELSDRTRTNRSLEFDISRDFSARSTGSIQSSMEVDHVTETSIEELDIVVTPTRRTTFSVSPELTYALDSTDTIRAGAGFERSISVSEDVADESSRRVNASWTKSLNEVSAYSIGAYYNVSQLVLNGRTIDTDLIYGFIGYQLNLSETLSMTLNLGPSIRNTKVDYTVGPELEYESRTYYADGNLSWAGERSSLDVGLSREQTQSALGVDTTRSTLRANCNYTWSELLDFGLSASYSITRRDQSSDSDSEVATYSLSPHISYKLSQDIDLRLNYTYDRREEPGNSTDERNRVAFTIAQSFDKLFD